MPSLHLYILAAELIAKVTVVIFPLRIVYHQSLDIFREFGRCDDVNA